VTETQIAKKGCPHYGAPVLDNTRRRRLSPTLWRPLRIRSLLSAPVQLRPHYPAPQFVRFSAKTGLQDQPKPARSKRLVLARSGRYKKIGVPHRNYQTCNAFGEITACANMVDQTFETFISGLVRGLNRDRSVAAFFTQPNARDGNHMESCQTAKVAALRDAAPRVVVITGGSSGIGRCTAALFAQRGWRVGLIARGAEGLLATSLDVEAAGMGVATAQADVTDCAALLQAANAIKAELGPIDVWINCAGNGVYGRFEDVPETEFQRVTDVTYHGTVNGTRVALSHMRPRGKGSIVNVCSAIAFHGLPLLSSYAGAKAAVRAFGQAIHGELALDRSHIKISTVFPPAVNTPFFCHATTHMGWPARPARPVYQPEVVAQGIWQAVASGRREMTISGTAAVFSLMTFLAPALIAWCTARLGMERQLTRDHEISQLQEPTLFTPSVRVFGVRGPFGRWARGWSTQLWLERLLMTVTTVFTRPKCHRAERPDVLSLSTLVPPGADRELEG
jgi:short-subunit dehydrogenase